MARLSRNSLSTLDPRITVPGYRPSDVTPNIVHFGVGAFHRAHQAMFVDRLLSDGSTEWGICGVGVLPFDVGVRDALRAQDGLYTLVTVDPGGTSEARVIGSIVDYLYAPDDPDAVLDRLADPATRIVSMTITEGGYGIDDATGRFDPRDELTVSDLAGDGMAPRSVFGFIVAALRRRRDSGIAPFTVMSCDNIQGNGHVARTAIISFAARHDTELAEWIGESVAFPSSMVDRITPATTDDTRRSVLEEFDVEDRWPIRSESFVQWVLEDRFPLGRPALDTVGVQIVDDVEPYELMKLRLLNASHQALGYLGILAGLTWVHEAAGAPSFQDYLLRYMSREATPTLKPVPGIDLGEYRQQLIERFASPATRDTLERLVVDGSDRIPTFLLPVLREQLASGGEITVTALVLASWAAFVEAEPARDHPIVDRRRAELIRAVAEDVREPGAFLDLREVFGDLGADPRLRAEYLHWRDVLRDTDALAALATLADRA